MTALAIVQLAQAALSAASSKEFAEIIGSLKGLLGTLFRAGLVTKAEQDATAAYLDSVQDLVTAGVVPPHWQVQPDPA
jgi:hypothetical protein